MLDYLDVTDADARTIAVFFGAAVLAIVILSVLEWRRRKRQRRY